MSSCEFVKKFLMRKRKDKTKIIWTFLNFVVKLILELLRFQNSLSFFWTSWFLSFYWSSWFLSFPSFYWNSWFLSFLPITFSVHPKIQSKLQSSLKAHEMSKVHSKSLKLSSNPCQSSKNHDSAKNLTHDNKFLNWSTLK